MFLGGLGSGLPRPTLLPAQGCPCLPSPALQDKGPLLSLRTPVGQCLASDPTQWVRSKDTKPLMTALMLNVSPQNKRSPCCSQCSTKRRGCVWGGGTSGRVCPGCDADTETPWGQAGHPGIGRPAPACPTGRSQALHWGVPQQGRRSLPWCPQGLAWVGVGSTHLAWSPTQQREPGSPP